MPFQAIAYAARVSTGTPLSKLVWIKLASDCHLDGYAEVDVDDLVRFTHADHRQVLDSLHHLYAMGLIYWPKSDFRHRDDWSCCICKLPTSDTDPAERKRPKLTEDQLAAIDTGRCPCCLRQQVRDGEPEAADTSHYFVGEYHVDHIIPRSIGGADVELNLQKLCPRCNGRKRDRAGWVDFL